MGAAFNLVTKSGGNSLRGTSSSTTRAATSSRRTRRPARRGPPSSRPKTKSDWDFSANLGGPAIKDRLWYFVSAQYANAVSTPFYRGSAPESQREDIDDTKHRYMGKLTFQATARPQLVGMAFYDDRFVDNRGAGGLLLSTAARTPGVAELGVQRDRREPPERDELPERQVHRLHRPRRSSPELRSGQARAERRLDRLRLGQRGLHPETEGPAGDPRRELVALRRRPLRRPRLAHLQVRRELRVGRLRPGAAAQRRLQLLRSLFALPRGDRRRTDGRLLREPVMRGLLVRPRKRDLPRLGPARLQPLRAGLHPARSVHGERRPPLHAVCRGLRERRRVRLRGLHARPARGPRRDVFGTAKTALKAHYGRYFLGMFAYLYDREVSGRGVHAGRDLGLQPGHREVRQVRQQHPHDGDARHGRRPPLHRPVPLLGGAAARGKSSLGAGPDLPRRRRHLRHGERERRLRRPPRSRATRSRAGRRPSTPSGRPPGSSSRTRRAATATSARRSSATRRASPTAGPCAPRSSGRTSTATR